MRYLNNENTPFRAYITNLGKYTEGNTVGEWVTFQPQKKSFRTPLRALV